MSFFSEKKDRKKGLDEKKKKVKTDKIEIKRKI
jgi:hypothetical protein